jgi:cell division protein FtsA
MRNITVGIDLGTSITRVVVAEKAKGNLMPVVLGVGTSPSNGLRHGYITDIDAASLIIKKAVKEAEKNSGVKIKNALVSIGGISLKTDFGVGTSIISRADTEVTDLDIQKAIKASEQSFNIPNRKILFKNPLSFKIDGKEIYGRPEGMKGVKLEVRMLFISASSQHIDDLVSACIDAGIEPLDIIPSPIAASAVALNSKQKTVGVGLVNIGAETVSIIVYEENKVIGAHVFSIGSTDITNDIALGLKISLEEAETIKLGGMIGNHTKKKLDEIIEARLSDIFELVESYLKKIKRSELLPAGVVLTGGGSSLSIIEEFAKNELRLPIKIGTAEIATALKGKMRDSAWFVSYGLAVLGREYESDFEITTFGSFMKKAEEGLKSFFKQFLP